jgi:hypothetical protein
MTMSTTPPKPADVSGTIEFEQVSLAQARVVAGEVLPAVERMFDALPGGWEAFRQAQTRDDKRLGKHAMAWFTALQPALRPLRCAVHYPHVINRVAALWNKPAELEVYFDGLINSRRQNRKGFPAEVQAEIAALQKHAGA